MINDHHTTFRMLSTEYCDEGKVAYLVDFGLDLGDELLDRKDGGVPGGVVVV